MDEFELRDMLKEVLSLEDAKRAARHVWSRCRGSVVHFSTIDRWEKEKRNARIRTAYMDGVPMLDICERFDLSRRHVERVLRRTPSVLRQKQPVHPIDGNRADGAIQ